MDFKIIRKNKSIRPPLEPAKECLSIRDSLFCIENNFLVRLNKVKKELNESIRLVNEKINGEPSTVLNEEDIDGLKRNYLFVVDEVKNLKAECEKIENIFSDSVKKDDFESFKENLTGSFQKNNESLTEIAKQFSERSDIQEQKNIDTFNLLLEKVTFIENKSTDMENSFQKIIQEKDSIVAVFNESVKTISQIEKNSYSNLIALVENQGKTLSEKVSTLDKSLNVGIKNIYSNFLNHCESVENTFKAVDKKIFFETDVLKKALELLNETFLEDRKTTTEQVLYLKDELLEFNREVSKRIETLVSENNIHFFKESVDLSIAKVDEKVIDLSSDFDQKINQLNSEICKKIEENSSFINEKLKNISLTLFESIVKELKSDRELNENVVKIESESLREEIVRISKKIVDGDNALKEEIKNLNIEINIDDIEKIIKKNPKLLKKIPDHLYRDGFLQFEKPDGSWGPKIKLFNNVQHIYESVGGGGACDNINNNVEELEVMTESFDFAEYFVLKDDKISDKYNGTKINMVLTDEKGNVLYEKKKYL